MSNPLDPYLKRLEQNLTLLPQPRREAELEEVRQHLQALSEALREQGMSEEAAAQVAITQFGKSHKVGRGLVWAWRREQLLRWRETLGGALGWSLGAHYAKGRLSPLVSHLIMPMVWPKSPGWIGFLVIISVAWTLSLTYLFLIGWSAGRVTPRHAMQGALLSLVIDTIWGTLRFVLSAPNRGPRLEAMLLSTLLWMGLAVGVTIWGVRVGRRQSSNIKTARTV